MSDDNKLVDFGFKDIPIDSKQKFVKDVFESVSQKYDFMNDLMSLGVHRLWKEGFMDWMAPNSNQYLVDLAGGTGDIAFKFLKRGGKYASIVDINKEMIKVGRQRKENFLFNNKISWLSCNAEKLSLKSECADLVSISFGLRNVTNREAVLNEVLRVLKPGGRFMCLEFSKVKPAILKSLYDVWSFNLIPLVGEKVTGDKDSYKYLVESIRRFPSQESLIELMQSVGFISVKVRNLSGGIVAIHSGWKY